MHNKVLEPKSSSDACAWLGLPGLHCNGTGWDIGVFCDLPGVQRWLFSSLVRMKNLQSPFQNTTKDLAIRALRVTKSYTGTGKMPKSSQLGQTFPALSVPDDGRAFSTPLISLNLGSPKSQQCL